MSRHDLTDTEWNAIRNHLPKERSEKPGRPWADHRRTINGIMWILRVGAPWRDIPDCYGKWQTNYKRFRTWCVDGSIVRAHHSAVGGSSQTSRGAAENGLGRTRGGYSSKLHIACDGQGIPLEITVTAGQINEPTEFISLMDSVPLRLHCKDNRPEYLAGDKAYVVRSIFEWLESKSIGNAISKKECCKTPDWSFETLPQNCHSI